MLLQLREMVPAVAAAAGGGARGGAAAASASAAPGVSLALGANAICGISVGNYRRLPGEKGEDEVDDTTVDAEVVDAGDGDVDDSWRCLLKNTGPLEAMVAGLLAAPAAENSVRGPSPGERTRKKKVQALCASLLGLFFVGVVGSVVTARGKGVSEGGKRKESGKAKM